MNQTLQTMTRDDLKALIREVVLQILTEERENQEPTAACAWCEGTFPETALNFSSGDPACSACQAVRKPKRAKACF